MNIHVSAWHDNVVEQVGYPVASDYVERYWLPILGPSAIWMWRRLVTRVDSTVELRELGAELGLRSRGELGNGHPVVRTLQRLHQFGMVRATGGDVCVRVAAPPLQRHRVERLPEHLRRELDEGRASDPEDNPLVGLPVERRWR